VGGRGWVESGQGGQRGEDTVAVESVLDSVEPVAAAKKTNKARKKRAEKLLQVRADESTGVLGHIRAGTHMHTHSHSHTLSHSRTLALGRQ